MLVEQSSLLETVRKQNNARVAGLMLSNFADKYVTSTISTGYDSASTYVLGKTVHICTGYDGV